MRTLLFSTVLAVAALGGCGRDNDKAAPAAHADDVPVMAMDDVERQLAAKELTVVDCNGDNTRKKHGVVPGAILVDDAETYAASILPSDKQAKIAFYCSGPS